MSDTQDEIVTVVTVTERTTMRGAGCIEFYGQDRGAVLEKALDRFGQLQAEWRQPTYPRTFPAADGGWKAVVEYWGGE